MKKEGSLRDNLAQTRTDLAGERTSLAIERTAMAADRSLEAWIRTALSMISFGFTIYKFLQYMQGELVEVTLRQQLPRNIGLFLIGLGTVSIILGCVQYFNTMKLLRKHDGQTARRFPIVIAIMIGLLGLFLFITMAFRVEVI